MEQMETELETIEDRKKELENQLLEKEHEQQNLEKRALEDDLKEAKEKISLMEMNSKISNKMEKKIPTSSEKSWGKC